MCKPPTSVCFYLVLLGLLNTAHIQILSVYSGYHTVLHFLRSRHFPSDDLDKCFSQTQPEPHTLIFIRPHGGSPPPEIQQHVFEQSADLGSDFHIVYWGLSKGVQSSSSDPETAFLICDLVHIWVLASYSRPKEST